MLSQQHELRKKLLIVLNGIGLKAKIISENTDITEVELSRFKTGKLELRGYQAKRLNTYLDKFTEMMNSTTNT